MCGDQPVVSRCSFRAIPGARRPLCIFRRMGRAGRDGSVRATMRTECDECGHRLRAELRSAGAFRFVVHFDDDERSATHAERTPSCPSCGVRLDLGMSPATTADDIH